MKALLDLLLWAICSAISVGVFVWFLWCAAYAAFSHDRS